jgi:hypothetical protein
MTPFWVVFRSLFPPILCFCEGRSRAGTSNDAGFRLLVRLGNRLHAGDPTTDELLVDDGADIPSDGHSGSIDDLVAVLDAGLKVLGKRFVVLSDGCDRPVDGIAEGIADILALVARLAELASPTAPVTATAICASSLLDLESVPQPNLFEISKLAPTGCGWQLVRMMRPR